MSDRVQEREIEEAVAAFRNLMGEGDLGDGGFICVDRSIPRFPVIRFNAGKLPAAKEYVAGDDTNIVFTPQEDGTVKVDVYYI